MYLHNKCEGQRDVTQLAPALKFHRDNHHKNIYPYTVLIISTNQILTITQTSKSQPWITINHPLPPLKKKKNPNKNNPAQERTHRVSPLFPPVTMTVLPIIFDWSRHRGYLRRLTIHTVTPIATHHTKLQGGITSSVTGHRTLSDR